MFTDWIVFFPSFVIPCVPNCMFEQFGRSLCRPANMIQPLRDSRNIDIVSDFECGQLGVADYRSQQIPVKN